MTTTTYLEWEDQATGANNNTWGDVTDANLTIFEQAIARYTSISTTGGTTTLTSSQNRYPIIKLTGVLVSNATIVVRTAEKNWNFINGTTGNFTVTVKTLAGTGKTVPRGRAVRLYCDGTNVELVRPLGLPAAQAGGTVDVITATFEPALVSAELQDGTMFVVEAAGANTSTTPTFNPDGLGALTITKNGGQALVAGDIRAAGHKMLLCYDASSTRYELLNPMVDMSAYLTSATAASTYLTQSNAASTYAPLASPALTGNPTAPTPTAGDNDTSIATTAFVTTAVGAISTGSATLLGTMTTTSGASQSLTSLTLTSYKFLRFYLTAVSGGTSVTNLTIGSAGVSLGTMGGGQSYTGIVDVDLSNGNTYGIMGNSGATAWHIFSGSTGYSTSTTTVTVASTGGSFDAGSITVYGIK